MKEIWVIKLEENNPFIKQLKTGRAGQIFNMLNSNKNNKVKMFLSTFNHDTKRLIDSEIYNANYDDKIIYLNSKRIYKKNISFARILNNRENAKLFKQECKAMKKPNVIYCCWPQLHISYAAVKFAKKNNIPIIIDIRDFWPDIFTQPFSGIIKIFATICVNILYRRKTKYVMKNATSITSVIPNGLKLAEKYGRKLTPKDEVFYLSYTKTNEITRIDENLENKLNLLKDKFIITYIGSITNRVDNFDYVQTLIERYKNDKSISFVFCGIGAFFNEFKAKNDNIENVLILGHVGQPILKRVSEISNIGLLPYKNSFDFKDALPNKVCEYLAYGIPIITTLDGLAKTKLEASNSGFYTANTDDAINVINRCKKNIKEYNILRENAFNLFKEEFDADVVYDRFCDKIENIKYKEI